MTETLRVIDLSAMMLSTVRSMVRWAARWTSDCREAAMPTGDELNSHNASDAMPPKKQNTRGRPRVSGDALEVGGYGQLAVPAARHR